MSYFKKSLGAIDKARFGQTSAPEQHSAVAPGMEAFAKLKAEWPRCVLKSTDGSIISSSGYLYTFKDGRRVCSKEWNQGYYALWVKGQNLPQAELDLSKVKVGTSTYFKWLCRAQGPANNPSVAAVRRAFEKAGLAWKANADNNLRALSPPYDDPSRPKPLVSPRNVSACSRYVQRNAGNENAYVNKAYHYSVHVQSSPELKKPKQEHRVQKCAEMVPPELVPACEAALRRGDGTSIQDFLDEIEDADPNELQDIINGNMGMPSGIPAVAYYGAAAFAVVLVAAALRKK